MSHFEKSATRSEQARHYRLLTRASKQTTSWGVFAHMANHFSSMEFVGTNTGILLRSPMYSGSMINSKNTEVL
jgi:hypothetical protein